MNYDDEILTIHEVCELLKVKVSWVRHKINRKLIPFHKVGRLIRFQKKEVLAWFIKNKK